MATGFWKDRSRTLFLIMKVSSVLVALLHPVAAVATIAATPLAAALEVRKSESAICHCPSGQYFDSMKQFSAFRDLASCLQSAGREPKRGQGQCDASAYRGPTTEAGENTRLAGPAASTRLAIGSWPTAARRAPAYERSAFRHWSDADGDCINTRHEVLADLSTGPVRMASSGCAVARGRWNDPYTGRIHNEAATLDIDHLVPLKYAWDRGTHAWTAAKREAFANDPRNLFAVAAEVNRDKGARGATEWLPPNTGFHCEYTLRFQRIATLYKLSLSAAETAAFADLRAKTCR